MGKVAGGLTLPPAIDVLTALTADDIIRAGACISGVGARLRKIADAGKIAAAEPAARLTRLVPVGERKFVNQATSGAAQSNGYGNGYGSGYGSGGDGNGYGNGYGYGYGDGYGYGYGDGDGYGNGYGW